MSKSSPTVHPSSMRTMKRHLNCSLSVSMSKIIWVLSVVVMSLLSACGDSISMLKRGLEDARSRPGEAESRQRPPAPAEEKPPSENDPVLDGRMLIRVSHGLSGTDDLDAAQCAIWEYEIESSLKEVKKRQPLGLEDLPFFKDKVTQVSKSKVRISTLTALSRDGVVLDVSLGDSLKISGRLLPCLIGSAFALPIRIQSEVKISANVRHKISPVENLELRIEKFEQRRNGRDRDERDR